MYFILIRIMKILNKTNAVVWFHILPRTCSTPASLPSAFWWVRRTEKKRGYGLAPLSFSFYIFLLPFWEEVPSPNRLPTPGFLAWLSCRTLMSPQGTGLPFAPRKASAISHVWKWNVPTPNSVSRCWNSMIEHLVYQTQMHITIHSRDCLRLCAAQSPWWWKSFLL